MSRGFIKILALLVVVGTVTACGTRSYNEARSTDGKVTDTSVDSTTSEGEMNPAAMKVVVTSGDITDRAYVKVGDIKVTVSKNNIFQPDPTKSLVDEQLKHEAAKMEADAVIKVVYVGPKLSLFSWGVMEGTGQAVKFKQ